MCELLALSSSRPVRLTFSLHVLASHGRPPGRSHDGWGVAFYEGSDVALFREPSGAADSALVRHLESNGPATDLAISHIRRASRGGLSLANTQPFVRELGGRAHVFAHNGDLPGIFDNGAATLGAWRPIGQTDSERAFCDLLARMGPIWGAANSPSLSERLGVLVPFAADLRALGPANFLYADGDTLFAHADRRLDAASGRIEAPGLWMLQRDFDPSGPLHDPGSGVTIRSDSTSVLWIASVPLTGEDWQPLREGELIAVRSGEVVTTGN